MCKSSMLCCCRYNSSLSANPDKVLSGVNCSIADVASNSTILDCDHDGLGIVNPQCSNLDSVWIRCGFPPAPTTGEVNVGELAPPPLLGRS